AGLPSVVQELVRPALERGGRRGRLLIAGEAVEDGGRDRGPAGELGLERRDRGDSLWGGADPQEARGRVLLDRPGGHLREKRLERIVPTDDDRQGRVLGGDAIATHPYLPRVWWCRAMVWVRRWSPWPGPYTRCRP